jgi:hypothetical protein
LAHQLESSSETEFLEFGPLPGVSLRHSGRRGRVIDVLPYLRLDHRYPTAVILDKFSLPIFKRADGSFVSHGCISADAAESSGYNVIRVSETSPGRILHLETALPELMKRIRDRTVPVGLGDVLNISAVKSIPFSGASRLLDMIITRDNLKDMVPAILLRMHEVACDPAQSPAVCEFFRRQLESNRAVESIKRCQVEVVVAGGNDGPDWFNVALLTATTQLSARGADGKIAPWSADNSLTTPAVGDFEVIVEPRARLPDGSPLRGPAWVTS